MQAPSPTTIALTLVGITLTLIGIGVALLIRWSQLTHSPDTATDLLRWSWLAGSALFFVGAFVTSAYALGYRRAGLPSPRKHNPKTIPLMEAATRAYEETRAAGKLSAGVADALSENALTWFFWALWERLELFGSWPPSRRVEHIPWQRHNEFRFVIEGDDVRLRETRGQQKSFENLHVTEDGFAGALERIKAMG